MADQISDEQITLYSADEPDVSPGSRNLNQVTSELMQKSQLKEIQRLFRVFDDRIVHITDKTPKKTVNYMVNLLVLDSKPRRRRSISTIYLLLSILTGMMSYFTLQLKLQGLELLSSIYVYTAIILLATSAVVFFMLTIRSIKNIWQFSTVHGKIPVIEILAGNPTRSTARDFTKRLAHSIQQSKSENYFTDSQNLAVELSEHRRLRDEGVISNHDYELAKYNIMNLHGNSSPAWPEDTIH